MQLRPLKPRTATAAALNTDHPVPTLEQPELRNVSRAIHLTPAQAADWLNVTERALEAWRGNGVGPIYVELSSKTIRYRIEDLEAFVVEKLRRSTAPAHASLDGTPKGIGADFSPGRGPVR